MTRFLPSSSSFMRASLSKMDQNNWLKLVGNGFNNVALSRDSISTFSLLRFHESAGNSSQTEMDFMWLCISPCKVIQDSLQPSCSKVGSRLTWG